MKEIDGTLQHRLTRSKEALKQTEAAKTIFMLCMKWQRKRMQKKTMMLAVLEAQRREREMINTELAEDDVSLASYASSLQSKSVASLK